MAQTLNKDGKKMFKTVTIKYEKYNSTAHKPLYKANFPVSDPSRNLEIAKGQTIVAPDNFFTKYGEMFHRVSSPPPRPLVGSTTPPDIIVMDIQSSGSDWRTEELEFCSELKQARKLRNANAVDYIRENEKLRTDLRDLRDEMSYLRGLVESVTGKEDTKSKRRSTK